ncbi:vacuolar sorting protein 9, VPS9 domain protein (macronuclear) [Tetrahymena thermophila SB210]|uniref:Vacuolar sorting protein 9, VPS9 domain protein n=1 Tax=Tetrahymena thermophila (strain SB210) TaxID=312017 RepID=Q22BJ9_TETTS|nr:vacuolar sorting protein 9, VPS9 domain protein [Tetrahymena thermophila SB210]EAR82667.1 vacuolar sorting protein 9, VPS9 domain protein [Tetrahymena thermophila SB210]|eukprot:XP_001030330.1 vacuolar sorting protein 9, VPS9 domain protein [Tetrahymena thermophila SB210]
MGQKSSSKINGQKYQNDQKAQLKNTIKNKLKQYNNQIKQKIENNYSISNFNSNTYIAYNIKKKSDPKNQFTWFEYAEDECELIYNQKPYQWIEQTLRLLKYMKNDSKVFEFQKTQIISLIYTIETMTELDYLLDVPMEQYEDFFAEEELEEIVEGQIDEYNRTLKQQNPLFLSNISNNQESPIQNENQRSYSQNILLNQGELMPKVNIIEYNDQRLSCQKQHNQLQSNDKSQSVGKEKNISIFNTDDLMNENNTIIQQENNNNKAFQKDDKNIGTLIERIPIFEEELQENINGTKIDTNLMRSEIFTIMADQHANVLQYNDNLEQRQQLRERNQNIISQMNNNTLLLNNAAAVAYQENLNQIGNNQSNNNNYIQQRDSQHQINIQQNEIYIDALKMVNFYKRISNFLEKSLDEKLNGLRAIKKLYKKYFMEKYSSLLIKLQNQGKMEVQEDLIDEMLKDILQFIHFFLYCVIFFYDLDNILPQKKYSQLVNKENLWNFLVNIFFADDEIYNVCFELTQASLIEKEKNLQSKMINLDKVLPHHLEIHPKFCLNNKTIEWAKQQVQNQQQKNQNQPQGQLSPQQNQASANGQTINHIHKNNNQTNQLNKQSESPNSIRLSAKNQPSNYTNNIRLSQQHIAQNQPKKQLEMLEEESEIFLMNQNSKSSSCISQPKYDNNEKSQVSKHAQNKENQNSMCKNKSSDKQSVSPKTNQESTTQASSNQNSNSYQTTEQVLGREKRILSQSKCKYNQRDSDPYRVSMQDQDGKDEILEETCIPKISQLEERDSSSFIYNNKQQTKSHVMNVSSPKSQNCCYSPNGQNKNQISNKNSSKSNSSKNSKQSSSSQDIRLTQYNSNNAFRHQTNYLKIQRKNSLDQNCPYYKAIKKLQNLTFYNSPVHKMKLLVQCFELIPQCVSEFYEKNIDYLEQNLIASDDLINILVFIVLKSKCTQINSHLKLISSFLSKSTQQSKIGYYCTTLQIVCGYLESDKIYENVESLRTKSEFFNKTILQMNNSYLRKSNFNQSIDIASQSRIVSIEKLEFQNGIDNQQNGIQITAQPQISEEITTNVFENVVIV